MIVAVLFTVALDFGATFVAGNFFDDVDLTIVADDLGGGKTGGAGAFCCCC